MLVVVIIAIIAVIMGDGGGGGGGEYDDVVPVRSINSRESCIPSVLDESCQSAVDDDVLVRIRYSTGAVVYAIHDYAGGRWMLSLRKGDHVRVNGIMYTITWWRSGAVDVPSSGVWLQTCEESGDIRLISLRRVLG